MRPRTRHRRTLRPRGKERGGQGHENVLSTPAPPVIGSNHRGSHAVRLFRSPLAIGRCNWTKIELEFREDQFSFSEYEASSLGRLVRIRSRSRRETSRTNSAPSSIRSSVSVVSRKRFLSTSSRDEFRADASSMSNESCWFDRAYRSHVASPEAAAFESFALPIRTASILRGSDGSERSSCKIQILDLFQCVSLYLRPRRDRKT